MILGLFALGGILLALPGMTARPPQRLPLREWTPVATASLIIGAVAIESALALAAVPLVAHVFGLGGVLDTCRAALAPLSTDPGLVTWSAAILALYLFVRISVGLVYAHRTARRTRVEPWLGEHHRHGDFDLVIVPTHEVLAVGVPGASPQIVISQGLVEQLEPDHVDAVIHHEAAHHHLRHARYLVVLAALGAALGRVRFVGRSVAVVRDSLELWADCEAGSRDCRTRRSLRDALRWIGHRGASSQSAPAALVQDRVRRLERSARPRPPMVRIAAYAPIAVLAMTVVLLFTAWLTDAHHAVAFGAPCAH